MNDLANRLELSIRAAKLGVKVRTDFAFPPIPDRSSDWIATDDNTYEPGCPIGRGRTEDAAIENLLEQLEEKVS